MNEWFNLFAKYLIFGGFATLMVAVLLHAINAYMIEKSGKSTTRFETAAKFFIGLWFLNGIALGVFGILTEWFTWGNWEIWTSYGIAFLVSILPRLVSRKLKKKSERQLFVIVSLSVVLMIIIVIALIAISTGRY